MAHTQELRRWYNVLANQTECAHTAPPANHPKKFLKPESVKTELLGHIQLQQRLKQNTWSYMSTQVNAMFGGPVVYGLNCLRC